MDKNEILSRAQAAHGPDEGQQYISQKSQAAGAEVFTLICCILFFFNLWQGQHSYQLFTAYWAFWGASSLAKYRMTKSKGTLVQSILSLFLSLAFGAGHVCNVLGLW